jgi:hypothetical protein
MALFIIKIGGAFSTSAFSNVILINSASLCNVYWQIGGAVACGDYSVFSGTIVADGAISLYTGSTLHGRALTIAGAINVNTINASIFASFSPSIAGDITTCGNLASYSTESGKSDYVWTVSTGGTITSGSTTNSISVTWSASDSETVTVIYSDQNGCMNKAHQIIAVNPLPSATISSPISLCQNEQATLEFTLTGKPDWTIHFVDNHSNTWEETATTSTFTKSVFPPVGTTTYTVVWVKDGNNCTKNYP